MDFNGTFSVVYDGHTKAIDWSWEFKHRWATSFAEGSRWVAEDVVSPEAYRMLLQRFGLDQWADEFPLSHVIEQTPAWLIEERRMKEAEHGLPRLEVKNHTVGFTQHSAELYVE